MSMAPFWHGHCVRCINKCPFYEPTSINLDQRIFQMIFKSLLDRLTRNLTRSGKWAVKLLSFVNQLIHWLGWLSFLGSRAKWNIRSEIEGVRRSDKSNVCRMTGRLWQLSLPLWDTPDKGETAIFYFQSTNHYNLKKNIWSRYACHHR